MKHNTAVFYVCIVHCKYYVQTEPVNRRQNGQGCGFNDIGRFHSPVSTNVLWNENTLEMSLNAAMLH